jgi:hypothetical protein
MPSPSSNPTIGNSEKHLMLRVISVIRVLLCLALAGCSQDDQPTAPPALVEFVFPLEAGTTWHYRYSWYDYRATYEEQHGHQVWQSTGTGAQGSVKILVTRTDTARWWGGADSTTQITQKDTSFFIIVTPIHCTSNTIISRGMAPAAACRTCSGFREESSQTRSISP